MVIAWAEPVFQYERCDPHGIKPGGDLSAFFVHGQIRVTAAGRDDHRRHSALASYGAENGERGPIRIGIAERSWSVILPKRNRVWCLRRQDTCAQYECDGQKLHFVDLTRRATARPSFARAREQSAAG